MSNYLLIILLVVPIISICVLGLCHRMNLRSYRYVSLLCSLIPLAMLFYLLYEAVQYGDLYEYSLDIANRISVFRYLYEVDIISLWLAIACSIALFIVLLLGIYIKKRQKQFYALTIMVQFVMYHLLLCQDGIVLVASLLALSFLMLMMLGIWTDDISMAKHHFMYQLGGIFFISLSVLLLLPVNSAGWDTMNIQLNSSIFATMDSVYTNEQLSSIRYISFIFLCIGLLCYIPLFGIHRTFINIYRKGQLVVSMVYSVTSGIIGIYILYRVGFGYFPEIMKQIEHVLIWIFGIQWLIANINLWRQQDVKSWLGYLVWSQYSILMILLLSATEQTITLTWLYLLSFILCTTLLTLLLASLFERHQAIKWTELKGSLSETPYLAALFTFTLAVWWGLPAMSQFMGTYHTILQSFIVSRWLTVVIVVGFIAGISHSVRMVYMLQHGRPVQRKMINEGRTDLRFVEMFPAALLITFITVLGISPSIVIDLIQYDINEWYRHIAYAPNFFNQNGIALLEIFNFESEVWSLVVTLCIVMSIAIWMVNYKQKNAYVMLLWQFVYHILTFIVAIDSSIQLGVTLSVSRMISITVWYIIMFSGCYIVLRLVLGKKQKSIKDLIGLQYRNPIYALILLIFMLMLMSAPLTAGFSYQLFILEIWALHQQFGLLMLWVVGHALMALIPLQVIINMYLNNDYQNTKDEESLPTPKVQIFSICIVIIIIAVGFLI